MINLRRADLSDTKKFAFIKAEAYSDDRSKSLPDEDNVPEWYNGKWFIGLGIFDVPEAKRLIENYDCYMILLDDTPIGIFWFLQETEDSLELQDFCILPEYQGKGFGTKVLKLIEELYPNNKTWLLGTPYFCKRNRHLYEKAGYQYDGTASNDTVILYKKCI
jgi:GNAT superfamily N-acetyltransferase